MNQWIYEQGRIAGSFDCEGKGLYFEFSCRMQKGSVLRRLYALSGWDSVYVGIPDERGELLRRVKRKLFPCEVSCMIASDRGRSQWSPWRGELDGIVVEDAWAGIEAAKAAGMKAAGTGDAAACPKTDYKIEALDALLQLEV